MEYQTFGYDSLERRVSETDPLEHSKLLAFDAIGNQISTTDPNAEMRKRCQEMRKRCQEPNWQFRKPLLGLEPSGGGESFLNYRERKGTRTHFEAVAD